MAILYQSLRLPVLEHRILERRDFFPPSVFGRLQSRRLEVRDAETLKLVRTIEDVGRAFQDVAFFPDGKTLAVGVNVRKENGDTEQTRVQIWDVRGRLRQ